MVHTIVPLHHFTAIVLVFKWYKAFVAFVAGTALYGICAKYNAFCKQMDDKNIVFLFLNLKYLPNTTLNRVNRLYSYKIFEVGISSIIWQNKRINYYDLHVIEMHSHIGDMAEWSKAIDCKFIDIYLRRFKSCYLHLFYIKNRSIITQYITLKQ